MEEYKYKAINKEGATITGSIMGDSYAKVLRELESAGLQPFYLRKANSQERRERKEQRTYSFSSSKHGSVLLFTKQLANLLKAGIQLDEALDIILNIFKESPFKNVIRRVTESLKGGRSFASSLADYPEYFNNTYVTMIKAGEESGYLSLVCRQLVDDIEENHRLRSHIITSMIYPIILIVFSLLAVLIVLLYILPKFIYIYESYDQSLPLPTIILLRFSSFITENGVSILLFFFLIISIFWLYSRTEKGKSNLDQLLLRLPGIGNLLYKLYVSRITRALGVLLNNGVPLLKSLKIVRDITGNTIYSQAMDELALQVERGSPLSQAMSSTGVFPDISIYLIGVGERTGELGNLMTEIARDLTQEYMESLDRFLKFFEPSILILMGGIIAFLVFAMVLPVMRINTIM